MYGIVKPKKTSELKQKFKELERLNLKDVFNVSDDTLKIDFHDGRGTFLKEVIYSSEKGFSGGNFSKETIEEVTPLLNELI